MRRAGPDVPLARGLLPCWLLLSGLLLAGCGGGEAATVAASSAAPDVPSASPVPASAPPTTGEGAQLTFDDGSPGRLRATRGADGTTTANLELDTSGAPVSQVTMSAANAAADVTGLAVPLTGSAGVWTGQVLLPLPGEWAFQVVVQRNDNGFVSEDVADVRIGL